ncbi:MAG: FMN-binding protein [Clostridia bacterium]|nr:FMN-binding protein [Clostridia bacterium]
MKKGYIYTIIFIMAVSIVFSGLLAVVNAAFKNRIEINEKAAGQKSILYAMGFDSEGMDAVDFFEQNVVERKSGDVAYYAARTAEGSMVYAVPFAGSGLWGTIKGYIGIDGSFTRMIGIAFTEQNETPGLGGRIDEEWYKEQFRGISLEGDVSYGGDSGIDAITGATSTSNAVLNILNEFMSTTLKEVEAAGEE